MYEYSKEEQEMNSYNIDAVLSITHLSDDDLHARIEGGRFPMPLHPSELSRLYPDYEWDEDDIAWDKDEVDKWADENDLLEQIKQATGVR